MVTVRFDSGYGGPKVQGLFLSIQTIFLLIFVIFYFLQFFLNFWIFYEPARTIFENGTRAGPNLNLFTSFKFDFFLLKFRFGLTVWPESWPPPIYSLLILEILFLFMSHLINYILSFWQKKLFFIFIFLTLFLLRVLYSYLS